MMPLNSALYKDSFPKNQKPAENEDQKDKNKNRQSYKYTPINTRSIFGSKQQ